MRIHLYTASYNDARMLGYFFRHYAGLVERFFVFDDGSTDGTATLLGQREDVDIVPLCRAHPGSLILSRQALFDQCWKQSRGQADWVIVTDIDEFLWHPQIADYLAAALAAGVTAIPGLGFQMLAGQFPPPDVTLTGWLTRGAPWRQMSKLSLFRPDRLEETHYSVGNHLARPRGDVVYPARDELLNLHYKYLGLDYVRSRHAQAQGRLEPGDLRRNFGHRYRFSDAELARDWAEFAGRVTDVTAPRLHESHDEPRWWRG